MLSKLEHRAGNLRAFESSLFLIGHVLERRDGVTGEHTNRVVRLANAFGQSLELNPDELLALRWGAYLHDLGKFLVPISIQLLIQTVCHDNNMFFTDASASPPLRNHLISFYTNTEP